MRLARNASTVRTTPSLALILAAAAALLAGCAGWPRAAAGAAGGYPPAGEVRGIGMVGGVPSTGTTYAGSQRVLVRSPAGRLYLAYTKKIRGVDQVYVAASADNGTTWTDFPQISTGATNSNNPDLVVDVQGHLRLFWTKHELLPPTGEPSTGWKSGQAGTRPTAKQQADVAAAKNGFVKPGESAGAGYEGDYGTIRQIFSSTFDGRSWSPQVQLTHGDYNGFPSAAYGPHGVLHMVWYGYDGHNYQVIYSALKDGSWSHPIQISEGYPDSVNPSIAVDGKGNLHVAWYKYSPATRSYQIFYREYRASDGRWTRYDQQLSEDLGQAENVSMAVTPDGRVWVAWEGMPGGRRPAGTSTGVYVRSMQDGNWTPQQEVSLPAQHASEPSVAAGPNGRVYVFYQSDRNHQLYVAVHDGGQWRPPVELTKSGNNAYPNARWSRFDNVTTSRGIDYAWTNMDRHPGNPLGKNRIMTASFRSLP